jgi:hypothetical protein
MPRPWGVRRYETENEQCGEYEKTRKFPPHADVLRSMRNVRNGGKQTFQSVALEVTIN